jgi:hypothetical protein
MGRKLFTKLFWLDTFERLIATAGETFLGVLAGGLVTAVDWRVGGITIGTSALAALAKAMVAAAAADTDTASFTVDSKVLVKK